eukprot:scaffold7544_cov107-Isochrysis_galbana.AAC.6
MIKVPPSATADGRAMKVPSPVPPSAPSESLPRTASTSVPPSCASNVPVSVSDTRFGLGLSSANWAAATSASKPCSEDGRSFGSLTRACRRKARNWAEKPSGDSSCGGSPDAIANITLSTGRTSDRGGNSCAISMAEIASDQTSAMR